MKYILASSSPRRKEILSLVIKSFEIKVPMCDESVPQSIDVFKIPEILSERKAKSIQIKDDEISIGSDTIVIFNNVVFGKPKDKKEAFDMLKSLSGNTHFVVSGICIHSKNLTVSDSVVTEVKMREISDEEIKSYVENFNPVDKAGAYGIQEKAGAFIQKINGDYFNVVGFPLCRFCEMMKENFGVEY